MQQRFRWDRGKAEANVRKHGVSFHEAQTVFADDFSIMIPDPENSDEEERWIIIGMSRSARLLVVIYSERNHHIRLISARKTTRAERDIYEHTDP